MVNVDSRLYERHPDWTIEIPGHAHSEGRNQRILDLTQTSVQDFIIAKMSEVFSSADISYVKWDMNRTFTDYYSRALPADDRGGGASLCDGPVSLYEGADREIFLRFYSKGVLREVTGLTLES